MRVKYESSRAAQRAWSARPLAERKAIMVRFKELLSMPAHAEELAVRVTRETGRPITLSRGLMSVLPGRVQFFLDAIDGILAQQRTTPANSHLEQTLVWEPRGVVAHISAWNFPVLMGVDFLVPCLLCGCTTLYKPSELSPGACDLLVELFVEAGVPREAIGLCVGGGAVGEYVVEQPIDGMVFIGRCKWLVFSSLESMTRPLLIMSSSNLVANDFSAPMIIATATKSVCASRAYSARASCHV